MTAVTRALREPPKRTGVGRTLRNHNLWLTLGYVSLILLLSRTYA